MSDLPAAAGTGPPEPGAPRPAEVALLASVFVVAACGLLYELVAAALASWLLGDSVLQFSTIIGAYLFAMGIGSYLSRFVERALVATFLRVELLVGVIGGTLPALLFVMHNLLEVTPATSGPFRLLLYGLVLLVGTLVGLEIPLVMRILKAQFRHRWQLSQLVSQVLTFDYLGALAVAVAFPLVLLPQLGAIRTGTVFGLLNVAVAAWAMWLFRRQLVQLRGHVLACTAAAGTLLAVALGADRLTSWAEARFYGERIVHAASSPYQRIVVTAGPGGQLRLFLNGNLQFDSRDEHRYHEALVHPAMAAHGAPRRVAILGGGDGLALREVLRYPSVEQVWLVDLDAAITQLFAREPRLRALNAQAFDSPRVRVVNTDAFTWLESHDEVYDVVIVDVPDPSNFSLGKLYTTSFYALLERRLAASGYAAVQATSPLVARRSFWTVVATLEAVGLGTTPYHAYVPSFGEWGIVVASRRPWRLPERLPEGLRFVTREGLPGLLHFPPDMARVPAQPNRITEQSLVHIFEQEWGKAHR
ncbi:MAG: polyamine aminopropyltransferase [Betaproteobacteria bacterium]